MTKNFLAKKSWHTGSLKHMEKVWKAEQVATEEQAKIDALKKELAEEQRLYELKRLADEAKGRKSDRIEWMYTIKKGPSADEYLMGKAVKTEDTDKQEIEKSAKQPGALFSGGAGTNNGADAAAKVREDPMLAIELQRAAAMKELLNNPVQMKKIKDQLKKEKRSKKEKKEKKERKETKRRDRSRSRSRSPETHKDRRSRQSVSPRRHEKRQRSVSPDSRRSPSPSRRDRNDGRGRRVRPKMSEQERERRLAEMQEDAQTREELKYRRIARADAEDARAKVEVKRDRDDPATFINNMNRQVYIHQKDGLEERIRKNIHYVQRTTGTALVHEEA